ncbi:hypothetical protein [Streptomyces sp. NPDC002566]|uniref:hypothetical protein n=1 Tax=Streptomyces sp. NPDC002566 TaxID=3364650 RepID=UPI0036B43ACA
MPQPGAIRARVAAVVDVALAAVVNKDGFFHRRHLLAEARRHLALVLRGRRREPGLDEKIVDAAIATHCLDISEPKTLRGRMPAYRFYTRWPMADPPTRRPPDAEPETGHRPPAGPDDPGTPRLPLEPGEWAISRAPLLYQRAVIASTVLNARLRAARRTGRALYDVVAHQQAAMPDQLLIPFPDASEDTDTEPRPALDMTALRALKKSRTDVEALDLTAERLRHLQDAFTTAADRARATMDRYAGRNDAEGPHPVREADQQTHHP